MRSLAGGAGDTATPCDDLTAFSNQVHALSGNQLTTSQASQLLAEAAHIQTMLSC